MSQHGSSRTRHFVVKPDLLGGDGSARSNSTGSNAGFPLADNQPTVISKRPATSAGMSLTHASPMELGRLLEGQTLGHYQLEEFVGGGGMGAVFRALDTQLDRTVAVKVLSQDQAGDGETVRRFRNEAQSAARLDHENIGRVYYVGEDQGLHYIVFEFIEGVNLRDLVAARGPLPLAEALNYLLQTADALDHASRRDVVHRDIKPSNLLITPSGRAKLVDMGLARLHQVQHNQNDLTASGVTLGTFDYISPEQARDSRLADVRSDLYSLGCTFYFMLTGQPPFPNGTILQKLLQHSGEEPPDPLQYRPDLPEQMIRVLKKLLAKSPDHRYQTPADLIADLMLYADELGLRSATSGAPWTTVGDVRLPFLIRHLPWLLPLALLGAIVLALHLFWSGPLSAVSESPGNKLPPVVSPTEAERK